MVATRDILEAIHEEFGVSADLIRSRRRTYRVSAARHAAMWLMQRLMFMSLVEIGRQLGKRHHTTALYGIARMELRMRRSRKFRELADFLLERSKELADARTALRTS